MGTVISPTSEINRVEGHIRDTYGMGKARDGEIAAATEARLGATVAAIDAAKAIRDAAAAAEALAWAPVVAANANADTGIGSVRDQMWNALGRPRQSPAMDAVYPGGIATYTEGDLRGQPVLMQVLHARILAASAPQWSDAQRTGWAAEVESLRAPFATAVDAYRPSEAALTVAEAGYRAAVRTGQARLVSLKRDLKSLGLSEAQIHEIIPDAGSGSKPKAGGGKGGDGGGAGGAAGGQGDGGAPK